MCVPMLVSTHVETCVLLSKLKSTQHIEVKVDLNERGYIPRRLRRKKLFE